MRVHLTLKAPTEGIFVVAILANEFNITINVSCLLFDNSHVTTSFISLKMKKIVT